MDYLRPHLTAFATHYLKRAIDISDPEVDELQQALLREIFRQGGRVNPDGYFLDVIMVGYYKPSHDSDPYTLEIDPETRKPIEVMKAQLKSGNAIARQNLEKEYRGYRNDLFKLLDQNIPPKKRPPRPLTSARVRFEIFTKKTQAHFLDAETKYSAVNPLLEGLYNPSTKHTALKPLLDSIQVPHTFKTTGKDTTRRGLSILQDDTDGEHRALGVIKQLEVIQTHVKGTVPKIRLTIEEV